MLKAPTRYRWMLAAGALAAGVAALFVAGCADTPKTETAPPASRTDTKTLSAESGKTGTQLWSDNCSMCHNMRNPAEFSDTQWKVVVNHMRLQGNLTGKEQDKVIEFLQAAN